MTRRGAGRGSTKAHHKEPISRAYRGSEFQLQRYVVELLQTCGRPDVLWLAIPNGEARSSVTGAKLKAMGVRPGAADFLVVIKGCAHFLELKTARGRLSAAQEAFEQGVLAAGGHYLVARCPEDVERILGYWDALRLKSVADPGSKSRASVVRHLASYPVDVEQDPSTGSGQAMEERNGTAEIGSTAQVVSGRGRIARSTQADRHK